MKERIVGFDFARSLAVFGMVLVNYRIVLAWGDESPGWLAGLVGLFEGRAVATFVILAGVGISLMAAKARAANDKRKLTAVRMTLLKRALFLFVVGILYAPLWPADILHFYALYILFAILLLNASSRWLWAMAAVVTIVFVGMIFVLDYEAGWNWYTFEYTDFWTAEGMVRHLFFNGFHPVFPWVAFLFIGVWLGRLDMSDKCVRRRLLLGGVVIATAAEGLSLWLISFLSEGASAAELEEIVALFGTAPMPPMPLYIIAAGGTAVAVIAACLMLTENFRDAAWIRPFVSTGQLSLTLYVAHVVIGIGVIEVLGISTSPDLELAVISALVFCLCSVLFAWLWRKRFEQGPLEWVMRRLTP